MADEAATRAGSRAGTLQSAPLRLIELGIDALRVLYPQRISREFDDPAVGKYREGGVETSTRSHTWVRQFLAILATLPAFVEEVPPWQFRQTNSGSSWLSWAVVVVSGGKLSSSSIDSTTFRPVELKTGSSLFGIGGYRALNISLPNNDAGVPN